MLRAATAQVSLLPRSTSDGKLSKPLTRGVCVRQNESRYDGVHFSCGHTCGIIKWLVHITSPGVRVCEGLIEIHLIAPCCVTARLGFLGYRSSSCFDGYRKLLFGVLFAVFTTIHGWNVERIFFAINLCFQYTHLSRWWRWTDNANWNDTYRSWTSKYNLGGVCKSIEFFGTVD